MDSQIDVTLKRIGTAISTMPIDRASAHTDITDVPGTVLKPGLEDVWKLAKHTVGCNWTKALANVDKLYSDITGGLTPYPGSAEGSARVNYRSRACAVAHERQ